MTATLRGIESTDLSTGWPSSEVFTDLKAYNP
jgi:hypothetical protein